MIYLNGNPLPTTLFPDNTSQIWKLPEHILEPASWVHIVWDFSHEGEFMQLAQLKMLLDGYEVRSTLRLKYLPYGRQDKLISNETTFALRTFAFMLNKLDFEEIIIMDPHSMVATDLIKHSKAKFPIKELLSSILISESDLICYPDEGALKKYTAITEMPYANFPFIHGEKTREQSSGKILSYRVKGNPKDSKVMVVDDICDGGATFVILAKALYESGAREVNLFVTHGIFSKGLRPLFDSGIKRIFTKDGEASEVQNHIAYRRL